jgi:hypothetical protein
MTPKKCSILPAPLEPIIGIVGKKDPDAEQLFNNLNMSVI